MSDLTKLKIHRSVDVNYSSVFMFIAIKLTVHSYYIILRLFVAFEKKHAFVRAVFGNDIFDKLSAF